MTLPSNGLSEKGLRLTGHSEIRIAWQALSTVLSIFTIPLTLYLVKLILNLNLQLGFNPVLEKIVTFYLLPVLLGFLAHDFWPGAKSCNREDFEAYFELRSITVDIAGYHHRHPIADQIESPASW
jgi:hypothetical protein